VTFTASASTCCNLRLSRTGIAAARPAGVLRAGTLTSVGIAFLHSQLEDSPLSDPRDEGDSGKIVDGNPIISGRDPLPVVEPSEHAPGEVPASPGLRTLACLPERRNRRLCPVTKSCQRAPRVNIAEAMYDKPVAEEESGGSLRAFRGFYQPAAKPVASASLVAIWQVRRGRTAVRGHPYACFFKDSIRSGAGKKRLRFVERVSDHPRNSRSPLCSRFVSA